MEPRAAELSMTIGLPARGISASQGLPSHTRRETEPLPAKAEMLMECVSPGRKEKGDGKVGRENRDVSSK